MFRPTKTIGLTYVLIAVNVAFYICTSLLSGSIFSTSYSVVLALGQDNYAIANGEVWRFLTAMFVHANAVHIFGNMFFLLIFGLRAEDLFDVKEYLLVYFISGLAGGFLTFLFWPDSLSVGASGAVFGVLGACMIYVRRAIGQSIIGALMYAFFLLLMNVGPNVNVLAHLGGLVAGLLIGYFLATSRKSKPSRAHQYRYSYST